MGRCASIRGHPKTWRKVYDGKITGAEADQIYDAASEIVSDFRIAPQTGRDPEHAVYYSLSVKTASRVAFVQLEVRELKPAGVVKQLSKVISIANQKIPPTDRVALPEEYGVK